MRQTVWLILTTSILKEINRKKDAYDNIKMRLQWLNEQYTKTKGSVLSAVPVSGGKLNKEEERRLDNLAEREELENSFDLLKYEIEAFDRAWDKLTKNDQIVLTYFFILHDEEKNDKKPRYHLEKLMEMLNLEKTRIYEMRDAALCKFAQYRYGRY